MTETLNADFTERVVVDTAAMDWQSSPSPTVWRKRLDLLGGAESGRVTSVVRYDAGSQFHAHPHPRGEEILVLDGVFSDEHGDWPKGTYLLNPEGFEHAPFSREGCVLFVKLQQYAGTGRPHVVVETDKAGWQASGVEGVEILPLYSAADHPETMALARFAAGASYPTHDHPRGEEIFVLSGAVEDAFGRYPAGTWLRQPPGSAHAPRSAEGCTLYVKSGHL
ncbi:MAG: cupin domain-containing protein [Alphaproteobacteria bacterium]|nr:cupin domain-containing protein [Alphaproteobacteria bacterium]